ncbi:MAG: S-layer family protein [Magnetococcales bacterium]|nr:S-layer family protein [Magnetococcales bacterium]
MTDNIELGQNQTGGDIIINGRSDVDDKSIGNIDSEGGQIFVRSRNLTMQTASLHAMNQRIENRNSVDIRLSGNLIINGIPPIPESDLKFDIDTSSTVEGRFGGKITIHATEINANYGVLGGFANTGSMGDILLEANNILMDNFWVVSETHGSGNSGNITVMCNSTTQINGWFSADTQGSGNGGNIYVEGENISLTDWMWISSETYGTGNAGDIIINTADLFVKKGSAITSSSCPCTPDAGRGGHVTVNASRSVIVDGNINIDGEVNHSGIWVTTLGYGQGGELTITTPMLIISDTASIQAQTFGVGIGGDMLINSDKISVLDNAYISGETSGAGKGGNISIITKDLLVSNSASISTSSSGFGDAGNINLNGSIVRIINNSNISANSSFAEMNAGKAGIISLLSDGAIFLDNKSLISSSSENSGGGDIFVRAINMLHLRNSAITTSVKGGSRNGGNIDIDQMFFIMDHSTVSANAWGGTGGNVQVRASNYLADPYSSITASSALGVQGTVTINAPDLNTTKGLINFPNSLFEKSAWQTNRQCGKKHGSGSTFIMSGRGGLPETPGDLRASWSWNGSNDSQRERVFLINELLVAGLPVEDCLVQ